MKKTILSAGLAFLLMQSAPAAACYNSLQFEAEQGLRIHSELMVIGLTCIKMPGGQRLYDEYQEFDANNASLMNDYSEILLRHYRDEGMNHPQKTLDALRTRMANNISRMAIDMSTVDFCNQYEGHVTKAAEMSPGTVRR
ncbi:MAG: hypothetical protein KGL10_06905, partial [Alphaproteobacteria bacterium]|nr:hypothetical protein [Alphaproteobacteria bacterium]